MQIPDRRQSVRLGWNVRVELRKEGLDRSFGGTSVNLSQGGAAIETKNWQCFQVHDRTMVFCFIPPDVSGQNENICLIGEAVVKRVDQINEMIGVEFLKNLRQFERVQA